MKRREQKCFLLLKLWEEEAVGREDLEEFCIQRGILNSAEEFEDLVSGMEKKREIACEGGWIRPLISRADFKEKGFDAFCQTFLNGGSKDKMVFTPPNTSVTLK